MRRTDKSSGKRERKLSLPNGRRDFFRFQLDLLSFEKGNHRILENERFAAGLVRYMNNLYWFPHADGVNRILTALGNCAVSDDVRYREKSLFVLSIFIETITDDGKGLYLQTLSWIFLRWLHQEQKCLGCHEHVCNQLRKLLINALDNKEYSQLTPWLSVLAKIVKGDIARDRAFREPVERLHYAVLIELMNHPIVPNNTWSRVKRFEIDCLYQYFREDGAEFLIRELYTSESKSRRLLIISILSRLSENIVYKLIANIEANPPWFVLRNAIKIIVTIGKEHHYGIVRPFLGYHDSRVQREILAFIPKLPRKRGIKELLHILEVCNADIKIQVIPVLARSGEAAAEEGLIKLLQNRTRVVSREFDGVVLAICRELRNFPTIKVGKALRHILEERRKVHIGNDTVALAARDCFEAISVL